jgi:hypothetical protein
MAVGQGPGSAYPSVLSAAYLAYRGLLAQLATGLRRQGSSGDINEPPGEVFPK